MKLSKITDEEEKCDILLVLGGIELQDQYEKIVHYEVIVTGQNDEGADEQRVDKYASIILSLDTYYAPKTNKRYERHLLRSIKQEENEPFENFVNRTREQANRCEFIDINDATVDQIIEGCLSHDLRKKLLSEEKTFEEILQLGKAMENLQAQCKTYLKTAHLAQPELVQRVQPTDKPDVRCFNCNRTGHIARDRRKCPAAGVKCHVCGELDHYKICCPSKKRKWNGNNRSNDNPLPTKRYKVGLKKGLYCVNAGEKSDTLAFEVGGIEIQMLVDSGSPPNIITQRAYAELKQAGANIINERDAMNESQQYQGYGSSDTIHFSKVFETEIKVPGDEHGVWSHVLVSPNGQTNLLSKSTAFALGVLKIGYAVRDEVNAVTDVVRTYSSPFPKVPGIQLKIHIDPTVIPVCQPIRRLPIAMEAEVEQQIQELLTQKIIEKVEHPTSWVSPLVPVRKSDAKLRLCVDLRAANKAVLTENYPMPNIEEALSSIHKAEMLSTLDLESAFYHLELEPESRDITTFVARSGVYRFTRLVFGIKSAPELFQKTITNLIGRIKGVIIYLDDILIFADSVEEHDRILALVMQRLKTCNLRINEKKSVQRASRVQFLGFSISKLGVSLTETKIKAFLDMRAPQTTAEIRSLLGTAQFFGKFIENLAQRTHNMRQLLHKGTPFCWKQCHQMEFDDLKTSIADQRTLKYYDPRDKTYLITDAGPYGLGAVLAQEENGEIRPVVCVSRSLTPCETKYCQTEKECLGIIWAMEKLYMYLYGTRFTLITDCKPLVYLLDRVRSKPTARMERWILRLQNFDFETRYEPGDKNIADAFSRLCSSQPNGGHETDVISWITPYMQPCRIGKQELERASAEDPDLQNIRVALGTEDWTSVPVQFKTLGIKEQLSQYGNLILRGDRIVIPAALQRRVTEIAHLGHQGATAMKAHLRSRLWFPGKKLFKIEKFYPSFEPRYFFLFFIVYRIRRLSGKDLKNVQGMYNDGET